MKRTGLIASVLGLLCVVGAAVHVVGQQQPLPGPAGANAQQGGVGEPQPMFGPPPPQTRLEAIASQKGILITKGYTDIGEVQADDGSRLRLTAVSFTDARQSREIGIVISIEQRGNEGAVVAYVDADELDPLSEALDGLAKLDQGASPMANVEGVYRTRGDLEFGNLELDGSRTLAVQNLVTLPGGAVMEGSAHFRLSRLDELRQMLSTAKEQLEKFAPAAATK